MKRVFTMLLMCISLHGMAQEKNLYQIKKDQITISIKEDSIKIESPQGIFISGFVEVVENEEYIAFNGVESTVYIGKGWATFTRLDRSVEIWEW